MNRFIPFSKKQLAVLNWWCNGSDVKNKNGIMEDDEKLEEQAYIRYLAEKDDEGEEEDDFDNGESV